MMYYSDELARDHAAQRSMQLRAEAETERLLRRAKSATPTQIRARDRLLHAVGGLLVRWGRGLQQHSRLPGSAPALAAPFVDTRPA